MKDKTKIKLFIEQINTFTSKYPAQCIFGLGFIFGFVLGLIF